NAARLYCSSVQSGFGVRSKPPETGGSKLLPEEGGSEADGDVACVGESAWIISRILPNAFCGLFRGKEMYSTFPWSPPGSRTPSSMSSTISIPLPLASPISWMIQSEVFGLRDAVGTLFKLGLKNVGLK